MVTKLSPPRIVGLMMGIWFMATALGNYVAGWVAGFLENRLFSQVFLVASLSVAAYGNIAFTQQGRGPCRPKS